MPPRPTRRFEPSRPELPPVPDDVHEAIERACEIADELADDGLHVRICRLGPPRRLRVDLLAGDRLLCALAPAELLELGAGRLQVSQ